MSQALADRAGRLVSLDALRGAVMAFMILVNTPGDGRHVYWPLEHAAWHGWTPTDVVFPSFLWIVGVAITLSLGRRLARGDSRVDLFRKAAGRAAILFTLGVLVYVYPAFNLSTQRILGVLQRIAICYLASVAIFLMMLVLTTLYPVFIYSIHWFPLFPLIAGYLGLLLIGCAFIACGVFISSLCESQVMAGMGTITLLLFFWILNWNEAAFTSSWLELLRAFSLFDQFGSFAKGVIDLDHVTYFVFFIVFFLFLTQRSMEARKWTGRR